MRLDSIINHNRLNNSAAVAVFLFLFQQPLYSSELGCQDLTDSHQSPSVSAGQVISIDPDTGEFLDVAVPVSEVAIPDSTSSIKTEVLPDGSVIADPGDRFMTALVAEIVDGELITCHRRVDEISVPDEEVSTTDSHQQ